MGCGGDSRKASGAGADGEKELEARVELFRRREKQKQVMGRQRGCVWKLL